MDVSNPVSSKTQAGITEKDNSLSAPRLTSRPLSPSASASTIAASASGPPDDDERIPPPAPDGGLRAWLQVLVAHLAVFNAWGNINSFGIFQQTYGEMLHLPPSDISWIGSMQVFLVFFVGAFSGRALDAGYFRAVLLIGIALQLIGVFTTSVAAGSYWQILLAQGLCQGLGNGFMFCPTVALVSTYFQRKRALSLALAACGGATGGVVFPLIAQNLLPRLGFAWTIRVMGFVILFNSIIIVLLARTRLPPRKSGPLVEWAAFKELPYLLFAIGSFSFQWGLYFSYYYARVYAVDILHTSSSTSFSILLLINAIGVPGRIVPAMIADRWARTPILILAPCLFLTALIVYLWATVHTLAQDWAWIAFFGWFGASTQGLFPSSIASLSTDPAKSGTRIGMIFTIVSIACLTGPPLAGRLITAADGSYIGAQTWGGSVLLIGSVVTMASGVALVKMQKREEENEKR